MLPYHIAPPNLLALVGSFEPGVPATQTQSHRSWLVQHKLHNILDKPPTFGKVFLCHRKSQKERKLAVKVMKKSVMVQKNMVDQVGPVLDLIFPHTYMMT